MADTTRARLGANLRTRVGHDLVLVETVSDAIERFGDSYLSRIYTAAELVPLAERRGGQRRGRDSRFWRRQIQRIMPQCGADLHQRMAQDGTAYGSLGRFRSRL